MMFVCACVYVCSVLMQEMRGLDEKLSGPQQLPQQQQQQLQQEVADTTQRLRSLLYLAGGTINTLAVSTTEVRFVCMCGFWAPALARQGEI